MIIFHDFGFLRISLFLMFWGFSTFFEPSIYCDLETQIKNWRGGAYWWYHVISRPDRVSKLFWGRVIVILKIISEYLPNPLAPCQQRGLLQNLFSKNIAVRLDIYESPFQATMRHFSFRFTQKSYKLWLFNVHAVL